MNKILVIRLSSLGDVVLTLPVFTALRKAYPSAEIVALTKESFADALAGGLDITRTLILKKGESLVSLVKRVRLERFDAVIDLHGNFRSRIVSLFSGAQRRVRYEKAVLARRMYVGWRWPSATLQHHTLDRYLAALRKLDPSQAAFQSKSKVAPRNVLLIQTAFLGDAVLTTPLIHALHNHFPDARVTVLCTPETSEIFQRLPTLDVIVFDKRGRDHGLRAFWGLVGRLRAQQFDLALLPHRSFKSALIAFLAAIPRRIGFSNSQGRPLFTETVPFRWGVHDVDRNLALLSALGVSSEQGTLAMQPDPTSYAAIEERLRDAGVQNHDRLVGIHAGSVWATKRWLPERFAATADRAVRELGAKVIFVGGGKDREAMAALLARMKEPALNWVGDTTLRELIAVIHRCNAFLTNDSGPMHIAVACGVPTVAIFGPTTRELGFFPYGPGHQVIERSLECRPCGLHGGDKCPLGHFRCMRDTEVDEVLSAVRVALEKVPSPSATPRPTERRGEGEGTDPSGDTQRSS